MQKKRILSICMAVMVCVMVFCSMSATAFAAEIKSINLVNGDNETGCKDGVELHLEDGTPITVRMLIDNPDIQITLTMNEPKDEFELSSGEKGLLKATIKDYIKSDTVISGNYEPIKTYAENNPTLIDRTIMIYLDSNETAQAYGKCVITLYRPEPPKPPSPIFKALNSVTSTFVESGNGFFGFITTQPIIMFYIGLAIVGAIVVFIVLISKRL